MAGKLPSFQMYPGDWMKDPALRACSIAARGLWMDMLCLMFECDRRGYLQTASGSPYSLEQLARMTGCSTDEVTRLVGELETSGVFSRTAHGTIFSRRLSRDEEARAENRSRQNRHRKLMKTKENSNALVTHDVTHLSRHSSSSSSSSIQASEKGGGKSPPEGGAKQSPTAPLEAIPLPEAALDRVPLIAVTWLCEELGVALSPAQRAMCADNLEFARRELSLDVRGVCELARTVTIAARQRGELIDAWYLADGKWRNRPQSRSREGSFVGPTPSDDERMEAEREFYVSALAKVEKHRSDGTPVPEWLAQRVQESIRRGYSLNEEGKCK